MAGTVIRHPYITLLMCILGLMSSAFSHTLPGRYQNGLFQEAE